MFIFKFQGSWFKARTEDLSSASLVRRTISLDEADPLYFYCSRNWAAKDVASKYVSEGWNKWNEEKGQYEPINMSEEELTLMLLTAKQLR